MPHTLSGKSRRAELSASTKDQFTKRHRSYLNVLQYNLSTKSILHTLNNFTNFVDTYTDQISIYSAFNEHYIHIVIHKSTYISYNYDNFFRPFLPRNRIWLIFPRIHSLLFICCLSALTALLIYENRFSKW